MLRELKLWILGMLIVATAASASAFALYGPGSPNTVPPAPDDTWQQEVIGFREVSADGYYGTDIGTPRKLTEEYRWNTPVLYYAFDSAFLNYFGSNGVQAVEEAFAILNGLTNASSVQLADVPLDTTRVNFRASAIGLIDLKSQTLSILLEELGLASAERWTWCLHDRAVTTPPGCPGAVDYEVVQLNFDPITFEPSSYVNGTLFSYVISEICQGPPTTLADAYEFVVDPLSVSTAIAAPSLIMAGNFTGAFYTELTRDDVGGLRYLWRTNNMNVETVDPAATQIHTTGTNGSTLLIITTSNLTSLAEAASTNNPAQLQALFPDLLISDFTGAFQLVVASNTFAYFTNSPYSPAGAPATLVVTTVYTTNFLQRFNYTFGNVVTNSFFTNGTVIIAQTNVAFPPYAIPGSPPVPIVTAQTRTAGFINGDYYIIPTNICGFVVLSNLLTLVTPVTTVMTATNATATNVQGQTFTQTTTTFLTNHILLVRQTPCSTNAVLRPGMEKIRFVRTSYDSLVGQGYGPFTTNYTLGGVSGNRLYTDTFQRTINQPDILFTVTDLAGRPGDNLLNYSAGARSEPQFVRGPNAALVAGPGIIQATASITYNNMQPIYLNQSPFYMSQADSILLGTVAFWGSYDGTTNPPVVYPSGTSLINLENQVFMQITPETNSLPSGIMNVFYSTQLGANGGQPPYTFSLSPGSPGLPPDLNISTTGRISGIPRQADTFDFVVRLSDSSGRQVERSYSIEISP